MKAEWGYTFVVCDLIHVGHVNLFEECKKHCNILMVGVLTDDVVESYKRKPIIPFKQRLHMVESIRYVTGTIEVNSLDQRKILKKLKPDVFLYAGKVDVSKEIKFMEKIGGKFVRIPYTEGISSTHIIRACQERK